MARIEVKGTSVTVVSGGADDYISLTDIARYKDMAAKKPAKDQPKPENRLSRGRTREDARFTAAPSLAGLPESYALDPAPGPPGIEAPRYLSCPKQTRRRQATGSDYRSKERKTLTNSADEAKL